MVNPFISIGDRPTFPLLSLFAWLFFAPITQANQPSLSPDEITAIHKEISENVNYELFLFQSNNTKKITFLQSGRKSRYGFFRPNKTLFSRGLWIRAQSSGKEQWGFNITLSEPVDLKPFDSITLWIRSTDPDFHFWISAFELSKQTTIHSDLFPQQRIEPNQLLEVNIPLRSLRADKPMRYTKIQSLGLQFEFSPKDTLIEVLAIAFTSQNPSDLTPNLKPVNARLHAETNRTTKSSKKTQISLNDNQKITQETTSHGQPNQLGKPRVFKPMPQLVGSTDTSHVVEVSSISNSSIVTNVSSFTTANLNANGSPLQEKPKKAMAFIFSGFLTLLACSFYLFWKVRKKNPLSTLDKFILKFNTPPSTDTWKITYPSYIHHAWYSPVLESSANDSLGVSAFFQHAQIAEKRQIHLMPSLNFVRTLYRPEIFFSNPHLFVTHALKPSEFHLSDVELKTAYPGMFPVWIPPYWQKKHKLSQRILVSYGKEHGKLSFNETLQFNHSSSELAEYVQKTLLRFSGFSKGVRIEGAEDFFNETPERHGTKKNGLGAGGRIDFWRKIMKPVKARNPQFLFFSDAAGPHIKKLLDLGFDYAENNQLLNSLIHSFQQADLADFSRWMRPECRPILRHSIYNISDLFEESTTLYREQRILAAKVVSLLPGLVEHGPDIPEELRNFYSFICGRPELRDGEFAAFSTNLPDVLGFGRWSGKSVTIVLVNFAKQSRDVSVFLDPISIAFVANKMVLVDVLLPDAYDAGPMAMLGRDILDAGLSTTLSELSVKLFSVTLTRPISYEFTSKVRQLR